MYIIFDPVKDRANRLKHGASLALARQFEWEDALIWEDRRHDYGELRMIALGYVGHRLHYVVFVDRLEQRRIVSLRKANLREIQRYAEA
ncbi:BrnT family toxin [Bordetella petrii]|nr:BrnT family toxin [Bordetella petrii]